MPRRYTRNYAMARCSTLSCSFLACVIGVIAAQLFLPPVVGVANNGDFSKAYGTFDLTMPVHDEAKFATTKFSFDSRAHYWARHYSSELLLVPIALALNTAISKDGLFDLRCIGAIHALLFLAAVFLAVPLVDELSWRWRVAVYIFVLFVLCDVMYAGYLNSFYMDVATYLFLLLTAVLYLRLLRWHRHGDFALFLVSSALLITSKAQHALLGIWIALLLLVTCKSLMCGRRKLSCLAAAVSLTVLSVIWTCWSTPPAYSTKGCFTVVFHQILPNARDVNQTLAGLGLDDSWKPAIGMHCYSDGANMDDPAFVAVVANKLSYAKLAKFFLTHPRDAYLALRMSLDAAGSQRPVLGNFDASAGHPPFARSQAFSAWSSIKREWFEGKGSRYLNCYLALVAITLTLAWMERADMPPGSVAGVLALAGMASSALLIASLGDAADVPRHHFIFYALADLLLLVAIMLLARAMSRRILPRTAVFSAQ